MDLTGDNMHKEKEEVWQRRRESNYIYHTHDNSSDQRKPRSTQPPASNPPIAVCPGRCSQGWEPIAVSSYGGFRVSQLWSGRVVLHAQLRCSMSRSSRCGSRCAVWRTWPRSLVCNHSVGGLSADLVATGILYDCMGPESWCPTGALRSAHQHGACEGLIKSENKPVHLASDQTWYSFGN
jgi:hypothetical protein